MDARTPTVSWRPQLGEYARLRPAGTLGEVVEFAGCDPVRRYTLNLFDLTLALPVVCKLEDLEPVWPEATREAEAKLPGEPALAS